MTLSELLQSFCYEVGSSFLVCWGVLAITMDVLAILAFMKEHTFSQLLNIGIKYPNTVEQWCGSEQNDLNLIKV